MILQAMNQYYNRLVNSGADIPLLGFSTGKIHHALILDEKGHLLQVQDLRDPDKKMAPKTMTVPEGENRSANIAANFLWDNTSYVLGKDNKGNEERALKMFEAFKERHRLVGGGIDDEGMAAVLAFLDSWSPDYIYGKYKDLFEKWDDVAGSNLVFRLEKELKFVHERDAVKEAWIGHVGKRGSEVISICSVTGKEAPIARLHPKIKGVPGAQSSGASIVSFNLESFKSYGKDQSFNAPVGEKTAFSYTTALNYLLRFESSQKVKVGDGVTLFWSGRDSPLESFMSHILSEPKKEGEVVDDSGDTKEIRLFLEAARDGKELSMEWLNDGDLDFYILGLSPNASRISIRFWHVCAAREMVRRIGEHFSDLALERSFDNEPEFPDLRRLLRETAVLGKWDNISPLLSGAMTRSLVTGELYPHNLLTAVINRIRSDQKVNYLRAALIKAVLCRKARREGQNQMEVKMALDENNTNIGYRLGRLFAVLERVQERAQPEIKATIRSRFYGSASTTPVAVFSRLISLKNHHLNKLGTKPIAIYFEKMIGEIMEPIKSFPPHLSLEKQGLFAIGYYHQRHEFFKKLKNEKETNND